MRYDPITKAIGCAILVMAIFGFLLCVVLCTGTAELKPSSTGVDYRDGRQVTSTSDITANTP